MADTLSMLDLLEADSETRRAPTWPGAAERRAEPEAPAPDAPPYLSDPRADLEHDSALWQRLLAAALALDSELPDGVFARLHGVRCCGARLFRSASGGHRVQPDAAYLDGAKGWQADRPAVLVPMAAEIAGLLRGLA